MPRVKGVNGPIQNIEAYNQPGPYNERKPQPTPRPRLTAEGAKREHAARAAKQAAAVKHAQTNTSLPDLYKIVATNQKGRSHRPMPATSVAASSSSTPRASQASASSHNDRVRNRPSDKAPPPGWRVEEKQKYKEGSVVQKTYYKKFPGEAKEVKARSLKEARNIEEEKKRQR